MSAHTPGPWIHEGQGDITGIEDNGFGRGPVDVCSVYLRMVDGRHEANARLITAAPDLLEALKEYIAAGENSVTATDDVAAMIRFGDAEKAARAAIAKATGGAA